MTRFSIWVVGLYAITTYGELKMNLEQVLSEQHINLVNLINKTMSMCNQQQAAPIKQPVLLEQQCSLYNNSIKSGRSRRRPFLPTHKVVQTDFYN